MYSYRYTMGLFKGFEVRSKVSCTSNHVQAEESKC